MKAHQCINDLNIGLKRNNTRLVANLLNDNDIIIATERIKKLRDKKKAVVVFATYCPFCGNRLATKEETTQQCPEVWASGSPSRGPIFTFCVKRHGHKGDHRGDRAQWNKTGKVKITEPLR